MWSVARRPRWIAALVFALALAAGFAALGQWQLARSVATGTVIQRDTETIVPLTSVAKPQSPVTDRATAQLVTATGAWMPGDYVIVSDRLNKGVAGYWVVGHFSVNQAPGTNGTVGLVAAVGWSASLKAAQAALSAIDASQTLATVTVTGRYIPSESPQDSDFERGKLTTISPGAMINLWKHADPAGVYGGYLTSAAPADGLTAIDSPEPSSEVEVNLLNVFYAVEWVVFAGFALFLWYRLVKDAWEREQEEASEVN
ncbi:SURF1 family cytochrome oxidase biogenesis protein [Lacisediminihabitans profunda]|uniref:SURF1-like protein n=1 Tax=Lacisediminihabitans profunda TaxID=2594790 RepID=A0A5C8UP68_9MICO|nr:SURF1 family cytochrome oxidase biogenesis protein [Lacisediminihabitans profunda]TXN30238.1 hypothetical protein FVP33_09460 [Lacisediminihabitans profunda]